MVGLNKLLVMVNVVCILINLLYCVYLEQLPSFIFIYKYKTNVLIRLIFNLTFIFLIFTGMQDLNSLWSLG